MTDFPGIDKEWDMQYKYKIREIESFITEDFLISCVQNFLLNAVNGFCQT